LAVGGTVALLLSFFVWKRGVDTASKKFFLAGLLCVALGDFSVFGLANTPGTATAQAAVFGYLWSVFLMLGILAFFYFALDLRRGYSSGDLLLGVPVYIFFLVMLIYQPPTIYTPSVGWQLDLNALQNSTMFIGTIFVFAYMGFFIVMLYDVTREIKEPVLKKKTTLIATGVASFFLLGLPVYVLLRTIPGFPPIGAFFNLPGCLIVFRGFQLKAPADDDAAEETDV